MLFARTNCIPTSIDKSCTESLSHFTSTNKTNLQIDIIQVYGLYDHFLTAVHTLTYNKWQTVSRQLSTFLCYITEWYAGMYNFIHCIDA